jgi:hypothetical protein
MEELGNTTIKYWTNPPITQKSIIALLVSSTILLTCCRAASFGFNLDFTNLILAIIAFMMQGIAALAYFARGGHGNPKEEAFKFLRLLVVVWILSLTVFFVNIFPPLRWFDYFSSRIPSAIICSFIAVACMVTVTIRSDRLNNPQGMVNYPIICIWALIVAVINIVFFYLFVLDPDTTFFIKGNLDKLKGLFTSLPSP